MKRSHWPAAMPPLLTGTRPGGSSRAAISAATCASPAGPACWSCEATGSPGGLLGGRAGCCNGCGMCGIAGIAPAAGRSASAPIADAWPGGESARTGWACSALGLCPAPCAAAAAGRVCCRCSGSCSCTAGPCCRCWGWGCAAGRCSSEPAPCAALELGLGWWGSSRLPWLGAGCCCACCDDASAASRSGWHDGQYQRPAVRKRQAKGPLSVVVHQKRGAGDVAQPASRRPDSSSNGRNQSTPSATISTE